LPRFASMIKFGFLPRSAAGVGLGRAAGRIQ
jgi:hypothetical protein